VAWFDRKELKVDKTKADAAASAPT
jgi:hypothetical protein